LNVLKLSFSGFSIDYFEIASSVFLILGLSNIHNRTLLLEMLSQGAFADKNGAAIFVKYMNLILAFESLSLIWVARNIAFD